MPQVHFPPPASPFFQLSVSTPTWASVRKTCLCAKTFLYRISPLEFLHLSATCIHICLKFKPHSQGLSSFCPLVREGWLLKCQSRESDTRILSFPALLARAPAKLTLKNLRWLLLAWLVERLQKGHLAKLLGKPTLEWTTFLPLAWTELWDCGLPPLTVEVWGTIAYILIGIKPITCLICLMLENK